MKPVTVFPESRRLQNMRPEIDNGFRLEGSRAWAEKRGAELRLGSASEHRQIGTVKRFHRYLGDQIKVWRLKTAEEVVVTLGRVISPSLARGIMQGFLPDWQAHHMSWCSEVIVRDFNTWTKRIILLNGTKRC